MQPGLLERIKPTGGPRPLTLGDRIIFILLTIAIFIAVFRPVLVYMSLWRGDQYWMGGELEGGLRSYRKALILDPNNPRVRETLGYVYAKYKRYDESVGQYESAIRIEPENAENHYYLGLSLFQQKRYELAVGHFQKAIVLNPELRFSYFSLATSYERLGKPREAAKVYRRLQKKFPDVKNIEEVVQKLER
ncbi:MAG: tetratricopeptide repeat protein [Actinobacteria bacterium]|nr:tetratricopeptide repeat protein [Actinomycetota bacterium]